MRKKYAQAIDNAYRDYRNEMLGSGDDRIAQREAWLAAFLALATPLQLADASAAVSEARRMFKVEQATDVKQ